MSATNPRLHWLQRLVTQYGEGDVQAFSDRVKINRSTISLLLHGHREVSDKYVVRICNRLHVEPPPGVLSHSVAPVAEQARASEPAPTYGSRTDVLLEQILRNQEQHALLLKTLTELILERTKAKT